ncbi:MAG: TA system VapC family ribonuclease toxin [Verrucomicrobiales bacterium]
MSPLFDVSLLAACGWASHAHHARANRWLDQLRRFHTCPAAQMGFLRVSMSVAYGASFDRARTTLDAITSLPAHQFLRDDTMAEHLPSELTSRYDVTDAHLIILAIRHRLKLATLDDGLCEKPWAKGIAVNPLK